MLLALPAGVLADVFDRRLLLLAMQLFLVAVGLILTVITAQRDHHARTAPGADLPGRRRRGLTAPAWQALIPDVVERAQLRSAAVLGAVSVNVGRAVGPAIGRT